jgi:hypothetical protein
MYVRISQSEEGISSDRKCNVSEEVGTSDRKRRKSMNRVRKGGNIGQETSKINEPCPKRGEHRTGDAQNQ